MTEEEMKKLKQTVDYFGHWYDVIGEERVAILEKAVNELEATKKVQEENERLKNDSEENQDLATVAYMQGASRNKAKLDEAKEIIKEYLGWADWEGSNCPSFESICRKAESFLKECGE